MTLGVVGFVTADEPGGFAIIFAFIACLILPVPMLLISFVYWLVEYGKAQRRSRNQ